MATGVMPDTETEMILKNTFGKNSHPVRKFGRMMYWMPKFKVSKKKECAKRLQDFMKCLILCNIKSMSEFDDSESV